MPDRGSVESYLVEPQSGISLVLEKHQTFRMIDVNGKQVADLVVFSEGDQEERLSTAVTLDMGGSLAIRKGDCLFSNRYNIVLTIGEDTLGRHDILHPACSAPIYRQQYGIEAPHPNYQANLAEAVRRCGVEEPIPNPFNIFMNSSILGDGTIRIEEPVSAPGDFIEMRAEMDLIVGLAACSVEESACNAFRCTPLEVQVFR